MKIHPTPKFYERRINLVLDDVEYITKLLYNNFPSDERLDDIMVCLSNIQIALDLENNESDDWTFYKEGSRSHLNQ